VKRVLLDTGPLGLVSNPNASAENERCVFWMRSLAASGVEVMLPEIADYEVRRELLRAGKTGRIRRLDALKTAPGMRYLPLTTSSMLRAAKLWAQARQQGTPTADPKALDCDVILAAQAQLQEAAGDEVVVATGNPIHIGLFVAAEDWRNIRP
jgi:predicted nucleic acid-binding protein